MNKYLLWLCVLFCGDEVVAHPMPNTNVNLSVHEDYVKGEAKMPLIEFGNAVGDQRLANMTDPFFKSYFTEHIQAVSDGNKWNTVIKSINIVDGTDPMVGAYKEVVVRFTLTPPDVGYLHSFTFNYDAIIHQVVTHSALVYVSQDWNNGIQSESDARQIGIVQMDVPTGKIFPLSINLEGGTTWKGFTSMLSLGMHHIKEGTDHLLFLIVLLLPAMLLTNKRQWGGYGGLKYSTARLLKIVTAFTIGHSITLLAGALGWFKLPGQPVEILIAVSVLVSAIHAVIPIFPGKETFVAAGFGLIHGLAFAGVLANLELSTGRLALSILGFNLGIEIMQLFVIAIIIPWLILLSKTPTYKWLRIIGSMLAGIASLAWIVERSTGNVNVVTSFVQRATQFSVWCIAVLAVVSLGIYFASVYINRNTRLVSG